MSKRGISPLIATVLIIGFTVALGSVILVWGGDFIKGLQSGAELSEERASSCAAATMDVTNLEQTAPNKLKFLLENTGQPEIQSVILRVMGDKGTASVTKPGLKPAGKKAYDVPFNPNEVGVVTDLGIIPTIKIRDKTDSCVPGMELESSLPPDTAQQWDNACPNGQIEEWEECEETNLNGQTCELLGYTGGSLACDPSYCTLDVTGCTGGPSLNCGNGAIDTGEECDYDPLALTPILPDNTSCMSLGFSGGDLYCTDACTLDVSYCSGAQQTLCGNELAEGTEECDGIDLNGQTCELLGYAGGNISCSGNCTIDTSSCSAAIQPVCGNNVVEDIEECDGTDMGGNSCLTRGYHLGNASCKPDCTFDSSDCSTFIKVASGCILDSNGRVYCQDVILDKAVKVNLGGAIISDIFPGSGLTICALDNTQKVYCWGGNNAGQVGNGSTTGTTYSPVPPSLSFMTNPTIMSSGWQIQSAYGTVWSHVCAINGSGGYCWGANPKSQLGEDWTKVNPKTSPAMPNPLGWPMSLMRQVATGRENSYFVDSSGYLYYAGINNSYGQNGPGSLNPNYITTKFEKNSLVVGITQIAAGNYHVCAIISSKVKCWGRGDKGQMGNGSNGLVNPNLVEVTSIANPTQLATNREGTCALNSAGEVYCWGDNNNIPTKIAVTAATQIAATGPSGFGGSYQGSYYALNASGVYKWDVGNPNYVYRFVI